MIFLGIDPGLSGGLASIDTVLNRLQTWPMPVIKNGTKKVLNTAELSLWFNDHFEADAVVIERVHAMPGQGVTSMFNFGYGCGLLEGMATGFSLPVEFVTPQAWQKEFFNGIPQSLGKKRSILFFQQRWPSFGQRVTDGEADAACIALWGALKYGNLSVRISDDQKATLDRPGARAARCQLPG